MRKNGTLALPSTMGVSIQASHRSLGWSASAPAPTTTLIWTTWVDWPDRFEVPVAPPFPFRSCQRQRLLTGAPLNSRHSGSNQLGEYDTSLSQMQWVTCRAGSRARFSQAKGTSAESLPFGSSYRASFSRFVPNYFQVSTCTCIREIDGRANIVQVTDSEIFLRKSFERH